MKEIGSSYVITAIAVIALLVFAPLVAWLGFEEGVRAYNRGDYATAMKEFRPLADQGHPKAQYYLGRIYAHGLGVPQDYIEAVKWYRQSAEQGDVQGQNTLGWMYNYGHGVPRDRATAHRWYQLAADKGHPPAQLNLGIEYEFGKKGVPQDYVEAVKWYRLAANQGYAPGQHHLARMYYYGFGVQQDFAEALKWNRLAADQGEYGAQLMMTSHMSQTGLEAGLAVQHDLFEKIKWYLWSWRLWPELTAGFWLTVFFAGVPLILLYWFIVRTGRPIEVSLMDNPAPRNLSKGVHRFCEVLVGLVSGLIGLGLLSLVAWGVNASIERWELLSSSLMPMTIVVFIGAFFLLVSYRLLTKRGARVGGGLLSPNGWRGLGCIFAGLFLMGIPVASEYPALVKAMFFCILFAWGCFLTANKLAKKSRQEAKVSGTISADA